MFLLHATVILTANNYMSMCSHDLLHTENVVKGCFVSLASGRFKDGYLKRSDKSIQNYLLG